MIFMIRSDSIVSSFDSKIVIIRNEQDYLNKQINSN